MDGAKLNIELRVINTDDDVMFYHIGGHPGIMLPISGHESINDCALVFDKEEDFVSYEYDLSNHCFDQEKRVVQSHEGVRLPLREDLFDNDAIWKLLMKSCLKL